MTQQIHYRRTGNLRKLINAVLTYKDSTGTLTTEDLTGVAVTFRMVNAADGTVKVTETAVGVVGSTAGAVSYQPVAGDVDTAGIFYGTFEIPTGSGDSYPAKRADFQIHIDSDSQSAQAAYEAAS